MADVGQEEDFDAAKQKALKIGASRCYIEDLRREVRLLKQSEIIALVDLLTFHSSSKGFAIQPSRAMQSTKMSICSVPRSLVLSLLVRRLPSLRRKAASLSLTDVRAKATIKSDLN